MRCGTFSSFLMPITVAISGVGFEVLVRLLGMQELNLQSAADPHARPHSVDGAMELGDDKRNQKCTIQ